ncbi:tatD related DNase family protein [Collimonas arenae]|uniref:TatD related DNase family protein n=1 Tax=Collimonas arenae TaxID=279058 RepID=A0A127PNU7_9BURK|nr:TatD family hydrolase [Collimonas arenae]AMO99465.1 tatD related DNase family protein [Collimonas arenae]AMP09367.1 tatD related DNase family protein [Collimonas arenae]
MWIDTHCHLDAAEFSGEQVLVAAEAARQQVQWIVIPAVERANFETVARHAAQLPNCAYALGIHPLYVPQADESDLLALHTAIASAMDDPRFVAIGEIGLDFFVPGMEHGPLREKQEYFYVEQLKLAREFDLPVLLHVRRSQDILLKHLRRIKVQGGIAHAFNGSFQQAEAFIRLGFRLGFGGAMTFTRALQIRRLAAELPMSALVLETDAPDMSPSWLHPEKNSPRQIPQIGAVLAELRGVPISELAAATSANARAALPRLAALR